jgi:glycosyltransferase involved in cell wall biosynthesis
MRIAMIAPFGIRPKGTLSARMLPLAQALMERGHVVQIIAPPVQNPQDAGTRVLHGRVLIEHTRQTKLPGPAGGIEQTWLLRTAALAMKPDVVHLFKPKGYGGLAVLGLPPDIPLIVDSDDWEGWGGWNDLLPYPRWAKWLFGWQERDLPRRANAVTVVSRVIEYQIRGFGIAAERVFYVPNGVLESAERRAQSAGRSLREPRTMEPARLSLDSERDQEPTIEARRQATILLYTRFWEFELPFLIAILARVAERQPHVRLLVVGRGEHGEEYEMLRLAEAAGLGHLIDYRGWAEPQEIAGFMAAADVALVPIADTLLNRARGLAKLLELMAAGLPIVASRVGQVAEYLVDDESGLLAAPGDAQAMADRVVALLLNPGLQEQLAAGARARAELFDWARLAVVVERAYEYAQH